MSVKIFKKGYGDGCTWHEQVAHMKRLNRIISRIRKNGLHTNSEQTGGTALSGKGRAYRMKTDFKRRAFERKGRKGDTFVSGLSSL